MRKRKTQTVRKCYGEEEKAEKEGRRVREHGTMWCEDIKNERAFQ